MKLDISREELLPALQSVIGVVERRQTMPILSNLLIRTDGGNLVLAGTDLELELITRCPANITATGSATAPARKFFDIVRGLPDTASLTIELKEQRLIIRSGRSRFVLSTLPAAEFPLLDSIDESSSVQVPRNVLRTLLDRTQFAMAHQDVRYYLNGLLLVARRDGLRAVATDGHRLAMSEVAQQSDMAEEMEVIVPRKAVTELARLLGDDDSAVTLRFSENHLQVTVGETRFTTKLIDGRFPDYNKVIPRDCDKVLTGDRETVRQALTRTAILSNEKFRGVRLNLESARLKMQAQNPDHEEAEEELEVDYQGEPLEIGFNVNYLLDALGALEGEQFVMEVKNADSSGLIREPDSEDHIYVVMPMRL